MATSKGKGWPKIGTVRKGEYGSYIKLNDNVKILVDGEEIPLNEKRVVRLQKPEEAIDRLQKGGFIDEKTADERREKLAANAEWLKFELIVPPPRKTE